MFQSLSHFEFIFVHGIRVCSSFTNLHMAVQFFQKHCWKDFLFPILYSCFLCQRLINHRCLHSFLASLFCTIDLYVCFGTSTTLSWWLWLCNIAWSLGELCLLLAFSGFLRIAFLRIALAILDLLWFHINFWIVCSSSVKNVMGNLIEESIDCFG